MILSVVVFPAPLGPMSPNISPFDLKAYAFDCFYGSEPFLEPFNRNDQIEHPLGVIMRVRVFHRVNLSFPFVLARYDA